MLLSVPGEAPLGKRLGRDSSRPSLEGDCISGALTPWWESPFLRRGAATVPK